MNIEREKELNKVINKKIEIYSYKFPNNSIYVGYSTYGLESCDGLHRKYSCSPIYFLLKEYPDVKQKLEVTVTNKSYRDINCIRREIFDANPNMKILNVNLWLYGY